MLRYWWVKGQQLSSLPQCALWTEHSGENTADDLSMTTSSVLHTAVPVHTSIRMYMWVVRHSFSIHTVGVAVSHCTQWPMVLPLIMLQCVKCVTTMRISVKVVVYYTYHVSWKDPQNRREHIQLRHTTSSITCFTVTWHPIGTLPHPVCTSQAHILYIPTCITVLTTILRQILTTWAAYSPAPRHASSYTDSLAAPPKVFTLKSSSVFGYASNCRTRPHSVDAILYLSPPANQHLYTYIAIVT